MSGSLLERAQKAFGVKDGSWTVEQEEQFALGLEEFIRTHKEKDADKKHVYEKGSVFVQKVYEGLGPLITLTPEMKAVYEELLSLNRHQKQFEKELSDYLEQGIRPKNHEIILKHTPPIFQHTGLPDRNIRISTRIINKAKKTHNLSNKEILSALQQISDPVLIFNSDIKKVKPWGQAF